MELIFADIESTEKRLKKEKTDKELVAKLQKILKVLQSGNYDFVITTFVMSWYHTLAGLEKASEVTCGSKLCYKFSSAI